jgi:CelD/BcsL family acetyltransferase involved in cellulose biosynthesis
MTLAVDDAWAVESWGAVLARIPDPHPFLEPDWQRAWWEHFGEGELEVLELGDAGVAALRRTGSTLRFLGGRDTTDYPGPAIAPGRAPEAAEALVGHLRDGDRLELDNARPEDGFALSLKLAARAAGLRVTRELDEPVALLTLPASFDAYLAGLSRHNRHELVRKRRRAAATTVRTAGADTLGSDLRTFFAFLRAARGEKGTFLSPRIEAFVRDVAYAKLARGTLRLDVLELDGRPLAVTLGFQGPRTYYLYNMGYDPAAAPLSPGIALLGALIERAIAERRERFDFMRGLEHYKLQLGATPSSLIRLRLEPV